MANDISAILQALQPTSTAGTDLFTLSPKTRQGHLFQSMLPAGLGLIAASAPSTDPGAFGKGLGKAGQDLFTNMNTLGQREMQRKILNYNMQRQAAAAELAKAKAAREAQLLPYQLNKLMAEANKHKMLMRQYKGWYGPETREPTVTPPDTFGLGTVPTPGDEAVAAGAPAQSTVPKRYQDLLTPQEFERFRILGPEKGPQAINEYLSKKEALINPRLDASAIITQERAFATDFDRATKEARERMSGYQQMESIFEDPSKMKISPAKATLTNKAGQAEPFERDIFKDKNLEKRGAADLALIFSFMKMLDPRSVVREGEFAQARDTGGAITGLYLKAKSVLDGNLLGEDQSRGLMRVARGQFNAARRHVLSQRDTFMEQAAKYKESGIQPSRMFRFTDYTPRITLETLMDAEQVG